MNLDRKTITDYLNRGIAFLVGALLLWAGVSASPSAPQSVMTIILLVGVVLMFAAVAGEIRILVRTTNRTSGVVWNRNASTKAVEAVKQVAKTASKTVSRVGNPGKKDTAKNPGKR